MTPIPLFLEPHVLARERALKWLEQFADVHIEEAQSSLSRVYELILGTSERTDLKLFFTSHLALLQMGREQRRGAIQRIVSCAKTLARYGEKFSTDPFVAARQLVEAAHSWPMAKLGLLRFAASYQYDQGGPRRFDWRIRYRAMSAALRCFAPSARRSRRLTALLHAGTGFFGQAKADARNNP